MTILDKINESEDINPVSVLIADNISDEAAAIRGYDELLLSNSLSEEDEAIIREIIADEKNHIEKLQEMIKRYDSNIEANVD